MGEPMFNKPLSRTLVLFGGLLTSILGTSTIFAQAAQEKTAPAVNQPRAASPAVTAAALSQPAAMYPTATTSGGSRAALMYLRRWGVENLVVRATSSGAMVRFSYHVVDANKAKMLNEKRVTPSLILERTGQRFEVPTEEKVGQLRQVVEPQNGREYWMLFGNRNHAVKRGDRVDIVVGNFRASGLTVE